MACIREAAPLTKGEASGPSGERRAGAVGPLSLKDPRFFCCNNIFDTSAFELVSSAPGRILVHD